jgi:hypothetical protein
MIFVTEGQNFETMFVEVGIEVIFYGNGIDLMAQSQELAKGKLYGLLAEINIEASTRIGLIESVEFGLIDGTHKAQN